MFLARRSLSGNPRFLFTRVGLFFLAAGVWLAGVVIEDERFTGLAIVILLCALALSLIGRRGEAGEASAAEEEDPEDDERL